MMASLALGSVFRSYSELKDAIHQYEQETHMLFVKSNSHKLQSFHPHFETMHYESIIFVCKQGKRKEPSRSKGIRPNQKTFKVACPVRLRIQLKLKNDEWGLHIVKCVLEHFGHPVGKEAFDLYPENCRIDSDDDELKSIIVSGAPISKLREHVHLKYGKYLSSQRLHNFKNKVLKKIRKEGSPDTATMETKEKIIYGMEKEMAQHLVYQVQMRPVLYDSHHPSYSDRIAVDFAYAEIGLLLEMPTDRVKMRWERLQKSYIKFKTRQVKNQDGIKNVFYLEDEMRFLDQHYIIVTSEDAQRDIEVEEMSFDDYAHIVDQTYKSSKDSDSSEKPIVFKSSPGHDSSVQDTPTYTVTVKEPPQESYQPDADHEFLKGLLPQIKELNKSRRRQLFQSISTTLFTLLEEQEKSLNESL